MRSFLVIFLCLCYSTIHAQSTKKVLDHSTYDTWNTIKNVRITNDGSWTTYQIQPGMGDPTLKVYDKNGDEQASYERSKSAAFSWDSDYLFFSIKAPLDSLKSLRRRKVEKEDLPKDTLAILNLSTKTLEKIPNVREFSLPAEWSGHIAYLLEPLKIPEDTTVADSLRVVPKPNNDENGYTLILKELKTARQDTFRYVLDYKFSKYDEQLVFHSSGDSTFMAGIYHFDCKISALTPLYRHEATYKKLTIDEKGNQVAFLADLDTAKHTTRYHGLYYWSEKLDSAMLVVDTTHAFIESSWMINELDTIYFSENGKRLFFGKALVPALPDTTLLEEEIVNVEVWNYKDQRLHTQQNIELEKDQKKGFSCWYDPISQKLVQLASEELSKVIVADQGNANIAVGMENKHYLKSISWEGDPVRNDVYTIKMQTGEAENILQNLRSYTYGFSPKGSFFYWINVEDSCWYAYEIETGKSKNLTKEILTTFTNEIHDAPTPPSPYGIAGWTENDKEILIYDRYDIWKIDPSGDEAPVNMTEGRTSQKVYRYLKLDAQERAIDTGKPLLLHTYDEITRDEGYAKLNLKREQKPVMLREGAFKFSKPIKSLNSEELIYTKQSFTQFPDLILSDINFSAQKQISNVNNQQSEYRWGAGEIVSWTSLDGVELEGMLFKPENFDPTKKYPMIVNFYEKSSDELHNHQYPKPERSTINYSLYTSNGYVIFNPDVHYRIGYPGESCYNSVIPGITKLIDQGFIDKDRIGVQGHSWGGYQIAYLVTKTDMFAAAEAGAPVPNMISAYGGIRWWTGLSRMFQYEHTQSRIGGTLWEYPLRFIENSPIFYVDKINTPLLIMHNDADGHVPWYQGIELFVALRRLNKPSWMLNYPGEPHWPLKRQNQIDFDTRMMQYFDYYLKGESIPKWMKEGIPAIDKGIDLGYELIED